MKKTNGVRIGDKFWAVPAFAVGSHGTNPKKQKGTVVYIHPAGRYAVLQFEGVSGSPRETFAANELNNRAY